MSDQTDGTKPLIVFIAAWGRTGSTLVGQILDQSSDCVSVGELQYLWSRGIAQGGRCECGQTLDACEFWRPVLRTTAETLGHDSLDSLARGAQENWPSLRNAALRRRPPSDDEHVRLRHALYNAIHQHSGCSVIVDSSKRPSDLAVMLRADSFNLKTLVLARDPVATAMSWQTPKTDSSDPSRRMQRLGWFRSTAYWRWWYQEIARSCRDFGAVSMSLAYEDLCAQPEQQVARLFEFIDLCVPQALAQTPDQFTSAQGHQFAGNSSKSREGRVRIELDGRSIETPPLERRLIRLVAGRQRRRFGYE